MTISGQWIHCSSPDGSEVKDIHPVRVEYDAEPSQASTLVMYFESHWDEMDDDTTGAVQTNSFVQMYEGSSLIWEGYIEGKTESEIGGEQFIAVYCRDPWGKLDDTSALLGPTQGSTTGAIPLFARSTPGAQLSQIALVTDTDIAPIGDIQYPYFFTTSSAVWLSTSFTNSTTLGANCTDAATSIQADTSHAGMYPAGFIMIGTEWIWYDGYIEDNSGNWWFLNCVRGALGSTAAAHNINDDVYQRVAQKIHPNYPVIVEGQRNGGDYDNQWDVLHEGQYAVQVEEGRIDFTGDPTNYTVPDDDGTGYSYDNFRITCGIYDEDGGSAIDLATTIRDLLKAPQLQGGPGLAAAEINVSIGTTDLSKIYLTRLVAHKPMNTVEAIRQLLNELELLKGNDDDLVAFWYDHQDAGEAQFKVQAVQQQATPDNTYTSAIDVTEDINLEDIYSAVRVHYTGGQEFNLIAPTRLWHEQWTAAKESADNGPAWLLSEGAGWQAMYEAQGSTQGFGFSWPDANQLTRDLITDGRPDTGWGWAKASGPGTGWQPLFGWFPGSDEVTPDTFRVKRVRAVLDMRETADSNPVVINLFGSESFTDKGTSAPTVSEKQMAGALYLSYNANRNLAGNNIVVMEADNVYENAKCVYFDVDYPQKNTAISGYTSPSYVFLCRELSVFGDLEKSVLVTLSADTKDDDDTQDGTKLYSASYAKLINSNSTKVDQFKVKDIHIGPATRNVAISLGRLALQESLVQTQIKEYEIEDDGATIPELMSTARLPDSTEASGYFQGVVIGVGVTWDSGERRLRLRVIDYSSGLVGG